MQWKILVVPVLVVSLACAQPVQAQASEPTVDLTVVESGEVPVRPKPKHRRKRSLMPLFVGVGVSIGGYVFSVLFSMEMLMAEPYGQCSSCRFGRRLLVPVVGPWLVYPHAEGGLEKGLFIAMGALQALGLGIAVWGAVKFVQSAPSASSQAQTATTRDQFTWSFTPLRAGGYGSLNLLW